MVVELLTDSAQVSLPSQVTIQSGDTSASFSFAVPENSSFDGTRAVTLNAFAAQMHSAAVQLTITDDDVHHFRFDYIPSPQYVGAPFVITVTAEDVNGQRIDSFSSDASVLARAGQTEIPLSLTTLANFKRGQWTGLISVPTLVRGVWLEATLNGLPVGSSVPLNVEPQPVRQVPLQVQDGEYDPLSGSLYVTSFDANAIVKLDPMTFSVRSSIPLGEPLGPGAQPGYLSRSFVLSTDGRYGFVTVSNGLYIRQVDLQARTLGPRFAAGFEDGPLAVMDMFVLPGMNRALVVAGGRNSNGRGVFLYDDGVARSNRLGWGITAIEPSGDPGICYGYNGSDTSFGLFRILASAAGLSVTHGTFDLLAGFYADFTFADGKLFSANGRIVNPEDRRLLGTFEVPAFSKAVAADPALGRVFSASLVSGPGFHLQVAEIASGRTLGSFIAPTADQGSVGRLFRWGENGLAVLSGSSRLYLVQTPVLIPSGAYTSLILQQATQSTPVIAGQPFTCFLRVTNAGPEDAYETVLTTSIPANSSLLQSRASQGTHRSNVTQFEFHLGFIPRYSAATVEIDLLAKAGGWTTNTAHVRANTGDVNLNDNLSHLPIFVQIAPPADGFAEIHQPVADLAFHQPSGLIYATVAGGASLNANSLLAIDPNTGAVVTAIPVAAEPGKLAMSESFDYLYFVCETNGSVHRWNFASNAIDVAIPVRASSGGHFGVQDIEALPGQPNALALMRLGGGFTSEVVVYDGAQMRPAVAGIFGDFYGERFEAGSNPLRLYVQNDGARGFARVNVTADGAYLLDTTTALNPLFASIDLEWGGNRLFTSYGAVINPDVPSLLTNVPGIVAPAPVWYDGANGRLFYLVSSGVANPQIRAYNASNFLLLATLTVSNVMGAVDSLIGCGGDKLAFRTSAGQIFVARLPIAEEADIALSQTYTPQSGLSGLELSIEIVVTNRSSASVGGVRVINWLPAMTELLSWTASQGLVAGESNRLSWAVGVLAGNTRASLLLRLLCTNEGAITVTNHVSASSGVPDQTPGNNSSEAQIPLFPGIDGYPAIGSQTVLNVRSTEATVLALVSPNQRLTEVHFEYGLTTNYTYETARTLLPATRPYLNVTNRLDRLLPGTTHHFRCVAQNSAGVVFGPDVIFTTSYEPDVTTLEATDHQLTSVSLNALINPHARTTEAYFEYGLSTNYTYVTKPVVIDGAAGVSRLTIGVEGLQPGSNYHARIIAESDGGIAVGQDVLVSTLPLFQVSTSALPGVAAGAVAWGDYDSDGWLDVLITGTRGGTNYLSQVFHNNGDETFSNANLILPQLANSAASWADFDNDGDLDFYLAGETSVGVRMANVYRNDGAGVFVDLSAGLPGLASGAAGWADFDRDGRSDLLIAGLTQTNRPVCLLYRNTANGFSLVDAQFPGFHSGSIAWADYDSDGDPDVLLTGWTGTALSRIYRNDMHGGFVDIGTNWLEVSSGSGQWGDYNNDGRLDFLLMGQRDQFTFTILLYQNDGNDRFSRVETGIPQFAADSVLWGDYDADGFPDILMTGQKFVQLPPDGVNRALYIFLNNRHGTFETLSLGLPEMWTTSAGWADLDNDGRLDFLVSGNTQRGVSSRLYKNNYQFINQPPAAPSGLLVTQAFDGLLFTWNSAADPEASLPNLTYNVSVTPLGGSGHAVSPEALPAGKRFVARPGNAGSTQAFWLHGLTPGTYEFSVQAIDAGFAGSPFASYVFDHGIPVILHVRVEGARLRLSGKGRPNSSYVLDISLDLKSWSSIASVSVDNEGLFDFLAPPATHSVAFYRLASP